MVRSRGNLQRVHEWISEVLTDNDGIKLLPIGIANEVAFFSIPSAGFVMLTGCRNNVLESIDVACVS